MRVVDWPRVAEEPGGVERKEPLLEDGICNTSACGGSCASSSVQFVSFAGVVLVLTWKEVFTDKWRGHVASAHVPNRVVIFVLVPVVLEPWFNCTRSRVVSWARVDSF